VQSREHMIGFPQSGLNLVEMGTNALEKSGDESKDSVSIPFVTQKTLHV